MKIALVGKPNVGKSALFNRLVGRKSAIVSDEAGVTRDRKCSQASLFGLEFEVIDTAGIDLLSSTSLAAGMNQQTLLAIEESDVILFVVDVSEDISEYDKAIALWIRKYSKSKPVLLVKNKTDKAKSHNDVMRLGFGDGIAMSALHNWGLEKIFEHLHEMEGESDTLSKVEGDSATISASNSDSVKIAFVGRPNVGKSTMINAIVGENRLLTGDEAGITRDAISVKWKFGARELVLVDTAGQRKAKLSHLEHIAVQDAWKNIARADIIFVTMDIRNSLEKQDLTIARKALNEGKVIVFLLNKSDMVSNAAEILETIKWRLSKEFAQLPDVPCLLVSAKEHKGLHRIFTTALSLHDTWSKRISTGQLNKWFQKAVANNPPPLAKGMPIKLKYISQTSIRPPTFTLFAGRAEALPVSYERYLLNNLRRNFKLGGVPLRLIVRKPHNPYDSER